MEAIFRTEHPKPQFMRTSWINLNGEWEFQFDDNMCGHGKGFEKIHFDQKINVPFCFESKLSGIGDTEFHNCVWYRRELTIPDDWSGKRVILHFGAVDYETTVYVNGQEIGTHKGGYTSFSFDITDALSDADNYVSVCAVDDVRDRTQPSGKQSMKYNSYGCYYTRTTGIWQTVWMEAVNPVYLKSAKYYADVENGGVNIKLSYKGDTSDVVCRAVASYEGKTMGQAETKLYGMLPELYINLEETHLWEVGCGRLYDLKLELIKDNEIIDEVHSYFGLRNVEIRGEKFLLNGKSVFGRWVLDQGFYPDGIYTAPSDEALPKTKIETDSYIAVQLIESQHTLDAKTLKYMAEKVDGSFSFSVLDDKDNIYLVKGDSPLCILHFPKAKMYVFASTEEILFKALIDSKLFSSLKKGEYEENEIKDGDILKICSNGKLIYDKFEYSTYSGRHWWDFGFVGHGYSKDDYIEDLKSVASYQGYSPEDIDRF